MDSLMEIFPVIIYMLVIVLIIILIILGIKLIHTVEKTNEILDDVEKKTKSLCGFFGIIDGVTDTLSILSDTVVASITKAIAKVFAKRKNEREDEDDE